MTITHTVKLPTGQQYEMTYFSMSLSTTDLPEQVQTLRLSTVIQIMEFIVQRELIMMQVKAGYLAVDQAAKRVEILKQYAGSAAGELVKEYGL